MHEHGLGVQEPKECARNHPFARSFSRTLLAVKVDELFTHSSQPWPVPVDDQDMSIGDSVSPNGVEVAFESQVHPKCTSPCARHARWLSAPTARALTQVHASGRS
jgi:hypothetical protein